MKFFIDFFPLAAFYITYYYVTDKDFFVATAVIMVATALQIAYTWFRERKIEKLHVITLVLVMVFGGLTLYLKDPMFLKWKVTIVEWLFAIAFLGSQFIGNMNFVERMFSKVMDAPGKVWIILNILWVLFFTAMGFANLYVAYNYSLETWVDFKTIWMLAITFVFIILQGFYLSRYMKQEPESINTSEEPESLESIKIIKDKA